MDSYTVESPITIKAKALYQIWYDSSKSMGGKPVPFEKLPEVQQRAWKHLAQKVEEKP